MSKAEQIWNEAVSEVRNWDGGDVRDLRDTLIEARERVAATYTADDGTFTGPNMLDLIREAEGGGCGRAAVAARARQLASDKDTGTP